MKMARIAGKSLLALVVSVTAASATPTSLGYTGRFQTFVAPEAGLYEILAFGAQGGNGGGLGVEIGGDFILSQGETLQVAVGGAGASATGFGGGGGGGTFVVGPGNVALAVAGGGGGAPFPSQGFTQGGLTGTAGGSVIPPFGGLGGTNGGGGGGALGAGGGGFIGNGQDGSSPGGGGASFGAGLGGGVGAGGAGAGGFGGGGGGGFGSGGGAGGYSGGGGGGGFKFVPWGGGGGGSFDGGADQILIPDVNRGDGSAVISDLSSTAIYEPSALALLGAGVAGILALQVRWRPTRRAAGRKRQ